MIRKMENEQSDLTELCGESVGEIGGGIKSVVCFALKWYDLYTIQHPKKRKAE